MSSNNNYSPRKRYYSPTKLQKSDNYKKPRTRPTSLFDEIKLQILNNKTNKDTNEPIPDSNPNSTLNNIQPPPPPCEQHNPPPPPDENNILCSPPQERVSFTLVPRKKFTDYPVFDLPAYSHYNLDDVTPPSPDFSTSTKIASIVEVASPPSDRESNSITRLSNAEAKDQPLDTTEPRQRFGNNHQRWGCNLITDYTIVEKIGMGTYGQVYKAKHNKTGNYFALKRVHLNLDHEGFPITAVREVKILRTLRDENIVNLLEVVRNKEELLNLKKDVFYLVFEYLEHDLNCLIKAPNCHFDCDEIASLMKQLLKALLYCHSNNYLHRDIKGSNILISSKGRLKLADFGLARLYNSEDKTRPYTNKVITLGYRPPELLLGEERYGTAIDIWSSGCILGELFQKRQIFKAHNELEQLEAISRLCGTISPTVWPSVVNLPFYSTLCPRFSEKNKLKEDFSFLPSKALALLESMLVLDPSCRISTADALNTPWMTKTDLNKIKFHNLPISRGYHENDRIRSHGKRYDGNYRNSRKP